MTRQDFKGFKANVENREILEQYTQYQVWAFMQLTEKQHLTIFNIVSSFYGTYTREVGQIGKCLCTKLPNGLELIL